MLYVFYKIYLHFLYLFCHLFIIYIFLLLYILFSPNLYVYFYYQQHFGILLYMPVPMTRYIYRHLKGIQACHDMHLSDNSGDLCQFLGCLHGDSNLSKGGSVSSTVLGSWWHWPGDHLLITARKKWTVRIRVFSDACSCFPYTGNTHKIIITTVLMLTVTHAVHFHHGAETG